MEHTTEHKHHVTPLWIYYTIGGTLLFFTLLTVGASYIPFSELTGVGSLNFAVAMIIATIKATLVALFFMHLIYDNKLYTLALFSAITTLMIFIVITMFDTEYRGQVNAEEARPIEQQVPRERFVESKSHGAHGEENSYEEGTSKENHGASENTQDANHEPTNEDNGTGSENVHHDESSSTRHDQ